MQLNRLGQMSLLAIESDIWESITIDYFTSLKRRKISLFWKLPNFASPE